MRIISGHFRGHGIVVPPTDLRPTQDKVRGAIFSTLTSMRALDGLRVLDLYAGTGALGFEALSRGASFAWFIDHDRRAIEAIKQTAGQLRLDASAFVAERADGLSALVPEPDRPFDLVFADPPYHLLVGREILTNLLSRGVCASGAFFVFEDDGRNDMPERLQISGGEANLIKKKVYSDTTVSYFSLNAHRPLGA